MYKIFREYISLNSYKQHQSKYLVDIVNDEVSRRLANGLSRASNRIAYRCAVGDHGRDNMGLYTYMDIHVIGKFIEPVDPKVVVNFAGMSFTPGMKIAEVYTRTDEMGKPAVRITLLDSCMPKRSPNMLIRMLGGIEPKQVTADKTIKRIRRMLRGTASLEVEHK